MAGEGFFKGVRVQESVSGVVHTRIPDSSQATFLDIVCSKGERDQGAPPSYTSSLLTRVERKCRLATSFLEHDTDFSPFPGRLLSFQRVDISASQCGQHLYLH